MSRFIEGEARSQSLLFAERLDDWIEEENPVRVIDAFVDELDMKALGFEGAIPAETGRPAYHPATLLKIYVYGYLNRVQSSRRLPRSESGHEYLGSRVSQLRLAGDLHTMGCTVKGRESSATSVGARFPRDSAY